MLLRLGSSRYAVAMADVAEVAAVPGVTRVPGSPPWLPGVANWRGRMLPVLDLRPLLATPTVPLASSARLVVAGPRRRGRRPRRRGRPWRVRRRPGRPAPPPPTLGPTPARSSLGQVADRHGPVAVLDAGAVLALRERVDRRRTSADRPPRPTAAGRPPSGLQNALARPMKR